MSVAQSVEVRTGEGSTSTFACAGPVSRMLARLPKRVVRLITRVSRSESIGGFVTWQKFWRKNWLISRGLSEMTASGVSSPIDPIASLASSTMGDEDQLHVLHRLPGGDLAAGQFGPLEARAMLALGGTGRSASSRKSFT